MQNLIKKAIEKIRNQVNKQFRRFINRKNQSLLSNHEMSVIASNCNGAFILHDLAEQFRSPFVNLYLEPADFVKYLQNIHHYMQADLQFIKTDKAYPVGKLEDLTVYFMHYHSEQEARNKWIERTKRINLDNLFILMTDRDGCRYEDLSAFDKLPFANKIVFTHKKYTEFSSALYIPGFEAQSQVGDLFEFSGWNGKKFYDQLDYVNWFNTGKY
ncbi:DUF1919 domain-containing protein [Basfia succiniciproducens]|uniref:DUF1919 domain-containing protein n=1 Tax=Basfia succiniciproducens TaxID=653940 RepID=UPI003FCDB4F5